MLVLLRSARVLATVVLVLVVVPVLVPVLASVQVLVQVAVTVLAFVLILILVLVLALVLVLVLLRSARAPSRALWTTSPRPLPPSLSCASTAARAARSCRTAPSWPLLAARISAVLPGRGRRRGPWEARRPRAGGAPAAGLPARAEGALGAPQLPRRPPARSPV